jgi:hypothetical protein
MDNENINENQTGGKYSSRIISIIGWVIHLVVALVAGYLAYYANAKRTYLFQKIVPIVFAIIYSYVYIIWHIIKYYILGQQMYSKGPLKTTLISDYDGLQSVKTNEIEMENYSSNKPSTSMATPKAAAQTTGATATSENAARTTSEVASAEATMGATETPKVVLKD